MNDKDKWKTFPCRDCLLKGKCFKRCFDWPSHSVVSNYIDEHHLETACLACGSPNATNYSNYGNNNNIHWWCDECAYY